MCESWSSQSVLRFGARMRVPCFVLRFSHLSNTFRSARLACVGDCSQTKITCIGLAFHPGRVKLASYYTYKGWVRQRVSIFLPVPVILFLWLTSFYPLPLSSTVPPLLLLLHTTITTLLLLHPPKRSPYHLYCLTSLPSISFASFSDTSMFMSFHTLDIFLNGWTPIALEGKELFCWIFRYWS